MIMSDNMMVIFINSFDMSFIILKLLQLFVLNFDNFHFKQALILIIFKTIIVFLLNCLSKLAYL